MWGICLFLYRFIAAKELTDLELSFERDAANNRPMPHGLSQAQQKAYVNLRELHKRFREGAMDKAEAAREKRLIVEAYAMEHSKEEFLERSALELSERISAASKVYRENRTIENADALYAAFYNLPADWYVVEAV